MENQSFTIPNQSAIKIIASDIINAKQYAKASERERLCAIREKTELTARQSKGQILRKVPGKEIKKEKVGAI